MANTILDDALVPVAQELLDTFGLDAVFENPAIKVHDPKTGVVTEGASVNPTVKIIPPTPLEDRYIDGDLRRVGDMVTGVANRDLTFTPTLGRTVTFDSRVWRIVEANPLYSGNLIALWELVLRK